MKKVNDRPVNSRPDPIFAPIFKKEDEMILKARILLSRIIYIGLIFSLLAVLPIQSQSDEVEKQEILRQMQNLVSILQPSAKQKISRAARELEDNVSSSYGEVDYYVASVSATKAQFGNLPSSDIEVLVLLVLSELMNSGEETQKEMMDEMHEMNQDKKKQRELVERLKKQMADIKEEARGSDEKATSPALIGKSSGVVKISPEMTVTRRLKIKYPKVPVLPTPKDIERLSASELDEEISNAENSLNFLGDVTSLMNITLQNQMQKQSQIIQTISNIIVNHYETFKALIQKLK